MKTTIDAAGRLVVPKGVRIQAGLLPGTDVEIHLIDGRVEIEPAIVPVKLVRKGRFLVAVSQDDVPPLTVEMVEETRDAILCERSR